MTELFASGLVDDLPTAEFSPCRTWRYAVRRRWGVGAPLGFVWLNSSTADERLNDNTVRRGIGFAGSLGYNAMVVGNLFAFRSKDRSALRSAADPIGPDNNAALRRICNEAGGRIICGWGNDGAFINRGRAVLAMLRDWGVKPEALSLTGSGEPGHPLYLRADLKPFSIPTTK
jgi:hypothetical protein